MGQWGWQPCHVAAGAAVPAAEQCHRDEALSLGSGSTNSKTLNYQRSDPREYQIVSTHTRKPPEYKTRHHPTTHCTLCRTPI